MGSCSLSQLQVWASILLEKKKEREKKKVRKKKEKKEQKGSHVLFIIELFGFQSSANWVNIMFWSILYSLFLYAYFLGACIMWFYPFFTGNLIHMKILNSIACDCWLSLMHCNLIFRSIRILGVRIWRTTLFSHEAIHSGPS